MDKKKSGVESQGTSQLSKSGMGDFHLVDDPYDLSERFKNLENPLKFIQNNAIRNLQNQYRNQQGDLKREQDTKAQFSKAIYKKVISRDNEYTFQNDIKSHEQDLAEYFNQRIFEPDKIRKTDEKVHRDTLARQFKHGKVISQEEKRERQREEREVPLTFQHVKIIDNAEFQQLKDVQFHELIRGDGEKGFLHSGGANEFQNVNIQIQLQNFKHGMISESQYHGKNSYNFLFDCNRELRFWRLDNIFRDQAKTEDNILSACAFFDPTNISLFQMFDFSSRNIEIDDVIKFYTLKQQLQAKMEMDRNNQSLEEKYNEAKKRFEEMKQNRLKSKNQRMPAKFISSITQTNDIMQEKDFDEYFVQDAKNIFDRLTQLNAMRDRIVDQEDGQTFSVMATNVCLEIGKELFKLLMLVLKGEKFLDYSQFLRADNEQEVQKKILELVYLQFGNFKELEVNGVSKVTIIKKYLQERQKNERFFETYSLQRNYIQEQNNKTARKSYRPNNN